MFTGIIHHLGSITSITHRNNSVVLVIAHSFESLRIGESVSVDGVCLTVIDADSCHFTCELSSETCRVTTASRYILHQSVNVERAMQCNDRFGGHIVMGHVDGMCKISFIKKENDFVVFQFSDVTQEKRVFLVKKGCITINGVSLTINEINQQSSSDFSVMVIPHTLRNTNLSHCSLGDYVNVEYDYFAKLIVHYCESIFDTSCHSRFTTR